MVGFHGKRFRLTVFAALMVPAMSAFAGRVTTFEDRDANQQQRIEQGLQSGEINAREAGRLQQNANRIDGMEAQAMRDGHVSKDEAKRIDHAQDAQSEAIRDQAHDRQRGNPNSRASQRAQSEAAHNARQEDRLSDASRDGRLSNQRAAHIEYRDARSGY